jgi:hypothetical protein
MVERMEIYTHDMRGYSVFVCNRLRRGKEINNLSGGAIVGIK